MTYIDPKFMTEARQSAIIALERSYTISDYAKRMLVPAIAHIEESEGLVKRDQVLTMIGNEHEFLIPTKEGGVLVCDELDMAISAAADPSSKGRFHVKEDLLLHEIDLRMSEVILLGLDSPREGEEEEAHESRTQDSDEAKRAKRLEEARTLTRKAYENLPFGFGADFEHAIRRMTREVFDTLGLHVWSRPHVSTEDEGPQAEPIIAHYRNDKPSDHLHYLVIDAVVKMVNEKDWQADTQTHDNLARAMFTLTDDRTRFIVGVRSEEDGSLVENNFQDVITMSNDLQYVNDAPNLQVYALGIIGDVPDFTTDIDHTWKV